MLRVGVDTGGTFTDFVLLDSPGVRLHKVRSTPDDPSRAILEGLRDLLGGRTPGGVVHGSTVATNAVLERRGATVALVATAGFEDVLTIGRQARRELYNFDVTAAAPLVDRQRVWGLRERLAPTGEVLEPLDLGSLEGLAARAAASGAEAVAVCLLHSYANPAHERAVADALAARGLLVVASCDVLPEYREFERWSTTVASAYVTPLMTRYLEALERRLGIASLEIMQSSGGTVTARAARRNAVQTILSGPAGGALGAWHVAAEAGIGRAIGFDMGGTSTDVTLLDGGPGTTSETVVGDVPVRLPMIDIHTVGAGGGSLAAVDAGGALRVGPQSAGADPGPACYGRGDRFTVTDANLLLGRLDAATFLGGRMALDPARARAAARPLADALGSSIEEVAAAVVRVANASMERAIRVVSVERGHDPRGFALVAFGGAGGMHAADLAAALDVDTVLVPRLAGVLSALGMLMADVTRDGVQTVLTGTGPGGHAAAAETAARLETRLRAELAADGAPPEAIVAERAADVRYRGQSFELTVPLTPGLADAFDRAHAQRYGYADPAREKELVNVRVRARVPARRPAWPRAAAVEHRPEPQHTSPAFFDGRVRDTAHFVMEHLRPGARGDGAAVIAGEASTTVVPPGWGWRVDEWGNLVLTRAGRRTRHASRRGGR